MSATDIGRVLAAHSIRTRMFRGEVQAEDIYSTQRNGRTRAFRKWQTVTGWNLRQLRNWLGY